MGASPSTDIEFSRPVEIEGLSRKPQSHEFEATADERTALAERLGIVAIEALTARATLRRTPIGLIHLEATLSADVVQSCVVTLEPVAAKVDERFELYFTESREVLEAEELDLPMEDELWPEPAEDGRIDLGETIAQQLALGLDPYPRAEGATFVSTDSGTEDEATQRPFADLTRLGRTKRDAGKPR